jgi:hypothetical protein
VFVVEEDMQRRWPAFHDLLRVRTPYRGIVALPMRQELAGAGAIDLYFRRPADVAELDVFAAMAVGELVTTSLAEAAIWSSWTETDGPEWLHSPAAEHRARVWQAMALIGAAQDLEADEALAVLRAQAYAQGGTVDDLADDLVSGRADPREVSGGAPPGRG